MKKNFNPFLITIIVTFTFATFYFIFKEKHKNTSIQKNETSNSVIENKNSPLKSPIYMDSSKLSPTMSPYGNQLEQKLGSKQQTQKLTDQNNQVSIFNQAQKSPNAQIPRKQTGEEKEFNTIIRYSVSANLSNDLFPQIIQTIAEKLINSKYQAGLLDKNSTETVFISFKKFDCVLFVETVLALARNIALQDYHYQTFIDHIVDQRYWNGNLNGYCSRLHYFSEWISDNQKRNNVQDISPSLGGLPFHKKLNFISSHRNLYPQLVYNGENYQCILEMEANISNTNVSYIPKRQISRISSFLQAGDIIGVVTDISGLDTTHTGFVHIADNGSVGLIHASPIGKVTISDNLQKYVNNINHSIGIFIARPNDPRQISKY